MKLVVPSKKGVEGNLPHLHNQILYPMISHCTAYFKAMRQLYTFSTISVYTTFNGRLHCAPSL